jgi:NADPH-dependent glutamate synthase beta subunit-like oxidoreductase
MSVQDDALLALAPELIDDTDDVHFVPAPCQIACPVGTDAPSYISYIWEEKFDEAFEAIYATNPFSSICGRVCDAPCEPACRRVASDGPIAIRNLKRFIMDKLGRDVHLPPVAVTRNETIGIVGSGPAGLTAAQDLAEAGYEVHVYEMTDRLGGMMVWGIPAFRLPPGIIDEDMDRMLKHCPGIKVHLDTALGREVTLDELKHRHDAVLLTIGAWWGKPMNIPGEDDLRVVDGVGFLRRVNAGERPELPETVVVVGGGDVSMDACRVAKRLPGCKNVKVVYRRGPDEIPARRDELEGAIKEGVEFLHYTQQVAVVPHGNGMALRCVQTSLGALDEGGRAVPVSLPGTEHDIPCGMVIAAVGQTGTCDDLDQRGMMASDRVRAAFETMRTDDAKVFAAGDGAFGGSTIVVAMQHGHRAAYYVKAFIEGQEQPLPYRTPFRTRRVPVAQDLMWEKLARFDQDFHGLGDDPPAFPEIESAYDLETAKQEAARCYRCDAETGSADYAVRHREDIFTMARTNPLDHVAHRDMLQRRLKLRENPFPEGRPGCLDDLVFLPANLSRLVIDPYREACRVNTVLGARLVLDQSLIVAGFDEAPDVVRRGVARGLADAKCPYLGVVPIGEETRWLQLLRPDHHRPSAAADGLIHALGHQFREVSADRVRDDQIVGLAVSSPRVLAQAIPFALERGFDVLVLDGSGGLGAPWPELGGAPDLTILRDAISILRELGREEEVELIYFGGVRSGTDTAKVVGLGANAIVLDIPIGLAAGGEISEGGTLRFVADRSDEERALSVVNILNATAGEASMMARCTGKTNLHNVEPEDLCALTLATRDVTGAALVGTE